MGVVEEGTPVFVRHVVFGSERRSLKAFFPIEFASFSICFGVGIRQLAGRSFMRGKVESDGRRLAELFGADIVGTSRFRSS